MFELIADAGRPGFPDAEWRRLIAAANRIRPGMFGCPDYAGRGPAGGHVEEYPDARILMPGDRTVVFVAKTAEGETALREAARLLEAGEAL